MRPPVPVVVRRLLEPMELGGYDLPAGTVVAPCVRLIHSASRATTPSRAASCPSASSTASRRTYTWIPFGGGVRRCLAASYAEMEMKRVLRAVLGAVELRPVDERAEGMRQKRDLLQPRPQRPGDRRTARRRSPESRPWRGLER